MKKVFENQNYSISIIEGNELIESEDCVQYKIFIKWSVNPKRKEIWRQIDRDAYASIELNLEEVKKIAEDIIEEWWIVSA